MKEKIEKIMQNYNYNFDSEEYIKKNILENIYLTYSELKEVIEILYELEYIKEMDLKEVFESIKFDTVKSKKEKGSYFLKELLYYKYPLYQKTMKKLKFHLNKIKDSKIKLTYPQNLEGDNLKIEITIKNEKDVDNILDKLLKNRDNLKDIISLIKK
ncbi:hypothetical protein [Haliovirga abyssi]|uniref:Uncharacterized protein n=1 Tax=Haliovirga abyssi TaxID=2996794 RepID=A0AAU9DC86_9FUSO|nr:hypothetical protein [Haliovirga abyssi]BDU49748.1 hypothetical protein HLVA_03170 [Haliovirga abyssi]